MDHFSKSDFVFGCTIFCGLLIFLSLQNSCDASCFEGVEASGFEQEGGNIGFLQPSEVQAIDEGIPLKLYCTLLPSFLATGKTPRHIFWQFAPDRYLNDKDPYLLKSDLDQRFQKSVVNSTTAMMILDKVQRSDSGGYKCLYEDVEEHGDDGRLVCSVTVNVGAVAGAFVENSGFLGPPKEYRDFTCDSDDYMDLVCQFRRTDDYPGLSKTNYHVTFRSVQAGGLTAPESHWESANCSAPTFEFPWYKCRWSTHYQEPNRTIFNKFFTYDLRITGSNPLGVKTWTHRINPIEHVRPRAPQKLEIKTVDSQSCVVTWAVEPTLETDHFLQSVGLQTALSYRKKEDVSSPATEIETDAKTYTLHDLDANAEYVVTLRSRTKFSGRNGSQPKWSRDNVTGICKTDPEKPSAFPGLIPGAYEVNGYGTDRQVTLYWKGVPQNKRNGNSFVYKISTKEDDKDNVNVEDSQYANVVLDVPFNSSVRVTVIPSNEMGSDGNFSGTTFIPAVHDPPLVIAGVNVVMFNDTLVELTFDTNEERVERYDIFYCKTSLIPHLARCTDTMEHETVPGNITSKSYNVSKIEKGSYYRYAVAAYKDGRYSGMTWARRFCSVYDKVPRLDGMLTISAPSSNGSVNVSWAAPCQQRFMPLLHYQLDYYPCALEYDDRCAAARTLLDLNDTQVTIADLAPKQGEDAKRYCFAVYVLDLKANNPYHGTKLSQCVSIAPPSPPEMSKLAVILGAVGGALVLAIVVILILRGVKRMRKDLKEIQKESRNINFPPTRPDKLDDEFETAYYSKIDTGEKSKAYTRQLSDNSGSSSGHGSLSSNFTVKGFEKAVDDSAVIAPRKRDQPARHAVTDRRSPDSDKQYRHSNVDLSTARDVLQSASDSADTVSLGRSNSPHHSVADIGNLKIHLSLKKPVRRPPSVTHTVTTDLDSSVMNSGCSGASEDPSSFGYVAASSLQATVSNSSSTGETGETGYVSHVGLSDSQDGTGLSALSATSSGFGDTESPVSKKWPVKPVMEQKLSYSESEDDPGSSRFRQTDYDNRSPVSSGPSSPVTTTRLLHPNSFSKPETSAYIAWP